MQIKVKKKDRCGYLNGKHNRNTYFISWVTVLNSMKIMRHSE